MKLMNRCGISRNNHSKPCIDLSPIKRDPLLSQKGTNTYQDALQYSRNSQKPYFLQANYMNPPNRINFTGDKSTATYMGTNPATDSVKTHVNSQNIVDWKILTLQQLRAKRSRNRVPQKESSCDKSGRGIYVSLSKSKKSENSRQKDQKPGVNQQQNKFNVLSSLSKKGQLIDRLESQIEKEEEINFFC